MDMALGGSKPAAAVPGIEEKRALLARSTAELDDEARKRAEQVRRVLVPACECLFVLVLYGARAVCWGGWLGCRRNG